MSNSSTSETLFLTLPCLHIHTARSLTKECSRLPFPCLLIFLPPGTRSQGPLRQCGFCCPSVMGCLLAVLTSPYTRGLKQMYHKGSIASPDLYHTMLAVDFPLTNKSMHQYLQPWEEAIPRCLRLNVANFLGFSLAFRGLELCT